MGEHISPVARLRFGRVVDVESWAFGGLRASGFKSLGLEAVQDSVFEFLRSTLKIMLGVLLLFTGCCSDEGRVCIRQSLYGQAVSQVGWHEPRQSPLEIPMNSFISDSVYIYSHHLLA